MLLLNDPPGPRTWRDSPHLYLSPSVRDDINKIIDEVLLKSTDNSGDPIMQLKQIKTRVKKILIQAYKMTPKVFNSALIKVLQSGITTYSNVAGNNEVLLTAAYEINQAARASRAGFWKDSADIPSGHQCIITSNNNKH